MISLLTKKEARTLLESNEHSTLGQYEPIGKFVVYNGCDSWDAIDNSSGDAWTENFDSLDKALAWLDDDRTKEDMEKEEEPTALANSGVVDRAPEIAMERLKASAEEHPDAGHERDYSADDGTTGNLSYDFETAFDQDRILHLHASDVELTELMTSSYERETGKSCVTWIRPGYAPEHESLPRPDEYETRGYTENFWQWIKAIEKKAIEAGVEDVDEMAAFFMGYLWPEAAELRGKKLLEELANEEPSCGGLYKPTLGEVLPLIHGEVEVHVRKSSDLTWSAWFKNSMFAIEALSKQDDGKLLGRQVVTVKAYSANATFTCGSLCLDGEPKTIVEIGG